MGRSTTLSPPLRRKRQSPMPYLFLVPCAIVLCLFVFYPFIKTVLYSLTLTNAKGTPVEFIGLGNYIRLFQSKSFYNSLFITLKFAVMVAVPSIVVGLILALLANEKARGSRVYEVMFSLPMAVASAPAAAIWFLLFTPGSGMLNFLLNSQYRWLLEPKSALIAVAIVTIWMNLGVNFIFLLTGLKNVPDELLESASIDGANYLTKVFHIILPVASPQIFFVVFLNIVSSFQAFAQIRLLTEGGPSYSTNVLVYSIYRAAFLDGRFETAFAQSIILFLIIFAITRLQFYFENKAVYYQ